MKIKRIELNNFKRFTHLLVEDIPDTTKLVVLVGPNGSGKTSFMESMNHYYKYAGYGDVGDYHYLSKTGNTDEYNHIEQMAVTDRAPDAQTEVAGPDAEPKPPIDVDFAALKSVNEDVVGWIYVEALDNISYPIVQGKDNEMYLHQTYEKNYNFAGTLFVDYENSGDFSDCNTLIYGHNMKNGSMFGHLKKFVEDQGLYNKSRYFWILTPDKNYRYEIISAYTTGVDSDTYTLFKGPGEEFQNYLETIRGYSEIQTDPGELTIKDKIVTLSTCTGNESTRFVVQGKRVNAEDDGSANSDAASVDSVTVQEG